MPPIRPPEYGSPEWQALAADDPLRRESVLFAADAWRLLNSSPHVEDLLLEWVEWLRRKTLRETSWSISAAVDWREVATSPTYEELERRRSTYTTPALTPEEIRVKAGWSREEIEAWKGTGRAAAA
jgi:hypothetical protein